MDEGNVRRIVREEIVKAFRILETASEPSALDRFGDVERIISGLISRAADRAADEIVESDNGTHPECPECDQRVGKQFHQEWCSRGA